MSSTNGHAGLSYVASLRRPFPSPHNPPNKPPSSLPQHPSSYHPPPTYQPQQHPPSQYPHHLFAPPSTQLNSINSINSLHNAAARPPPPPITGPRQRPPAPRQLQQQTPPLSYLQQSLNPQPLGQQSMPPQSMSQSSMAPHSMAPQSISPPSMAPQGLNPQPVNSPQLSPPSLGQQPLGPSSLSQQLQQPMSQPPMAPSMTQSMSQQSLPPQSLEQQTLQQHPLHQQSYQPRSHQQQQQPPQPLQQQSIAQTVQQHQQQQQNDTPMRSQRSTPHPPPQPTLPAAAPPQTPKVQQAQKAQLVAQAQPVQQVQPVKQQQPPPPPPPRQPEPVEPVQENHHQDEEMEGVSHDDVGEGDSSVEPKLVGDNTPYVPREPMGAMMSAPPEGGSFPTLEAIHKHVLSYCTSVGYAVVIGRSKKTVPGLKKVLFVCDRAGKPPRRVSPEMRKRKTTSRKCDCQFGFFAIEQRTQWTVRYRPDPAHLQHNHGPSESPLLHPAARKLDSKMVAAVKQLKDNGVGVSQTLEILQHENPHVPLLPRDIYNARAAINRNPQKVATGLAEDRPAIYSKPQPSAEERIRADLRRELARVREEFDKHREDSSKEIAELKGKLREKDKIIEKFEQFIDICNQRVMVNLTKEDRGSSTPSS